MAESGIPGAARGAVFQARYGSVDAFRGLAALAVVVHHAYDIHIGTQAVMVFFVISGYCIAAACEASARAGLGMKGFMWRRLRRIYPPYFLSLVFWAATRVVKVYSGGGNDLRQSVASWVQNLSLTQWLTLLVHPGRSATENNTLFVAAYWSLNYEEQFYIVMGLLLVAERLRLFTLRRAHAVLMLISLAWVAIFPQVVRGLFIEYWAPFGMGVLVFHRLCRFEKGPARHAIDMSLAAIAIVCGAVLWRTGSFPTLHGIEVHSVCSELMTAALFALLLVALRPADSQLSRAPWFVPLRWLGTITYSVYLTHIFLLPFAARLASRVWGVPGHTALRSFTQMTLVVSVGALFWYLCERPFLNRPLARADEAGRRDARAGGLPWPATFGSRDLPESVNRLQRP